MSDRIDELQDQVTDESTHDIMRRLASEDPMTQLQEDENGYRQENFHGEHDLDTLFGPDPFELSDWSDEYETVSSGADSEDDQAESGKVDLAKSDEAEAVSSGAGSEDGGADFSSAASGSSSDGSSSSSDGSGSGSDGSSGLPNAVDLLSDGGSGDHAESAPKESAVQEISNSAGDLPLLVDYASE